MPPEVEITSPEWYEQVDPGARRRSRCAAESGRAARSTPARSSSRPAATPARRTSSRSSPPACDGDDRAVARRSTACSASSTWPTLKALFPPGTDFAGPEHGPAPRAAALRPPEHRALRASSSRSSRTLDGRRTRSTGQDRRKLFLHRDADMLDGFPKQLPATARPRRCSPTSTATTATSWSSRTPTASCTRGAATAPSCPAGRRGDRRLPLHTGARVHQRARSTARPARSSPRRRSATSTATARPRSSSPTSRARSTSGTPDGERGPHAWRPTSTTPASRSHLRGRSSTRRKGKRNRTQHGFLGSPVLADLDGDDGGRLEIVAAAMDRHVYAWNDDGTAVRRLPGARRRPRQGRLDRPARRTPSRSSPTSAPTRPGRDRRHAGGRRPRRRRRTAARDRRRHQRGVRRPATRAGSTPAASTRRRTAALGQPLEPANGRLFAIKPRASRRRAAAGASPYRDGWPVKVGDPPGRGPAAGRRGHHRLAGDRRGPRAATAPSRRRSARSRRRARLPPQPGRPVVLRRATSEHGPRRSRRPAAATFDRPAVPRRVRPPRLRRRSPAATRRSSRPAAGVVRARSTSSCPSTRAARTCSSAWRPRRGTRAAGLARARSTTSSSSPARRSPTSTACRARRSSPARASIDLQAFTAGGHRRAGLAEADRRLDGREPADRVVRHARHRARIAKVVIGAHALGHGLRLRDRRAGVRAGVVAALPPRQRQLGRLAPRRGAARASRRTRALSRRTTLRVHGARRRPAVRHGRALRGRRRRTSRSTARTSRRRRRSRVRARRRRRRGRRGVARAARRRQALRRAARGRRAGHPGRVAALDRGAPPGDGGGGPLGGCASRARAFPPAAARRPRTSAGRPGSARGCVPTRLLRRATVRARGRAGLRATGRRRGRGHRRRVPAVRRATGGRPPRRALPRPPGVVRVGRAGDAAGRAVRDGILMVRFRAGGESKRFAIQRSRGRFLVRPELLSPGAVPRARQREAPGPVFGGRSRRGLDALLPVDDGGARGDHRRAPRARRSALRGEDVSGPAAPSVCRCVAAAWRPPRADRGDGGGRTDRVVLVARRL